MSGLLFGVFCGVIVPIILVVGSIVVVLVLNVASFSAPSSCTVVVSWSACAVIRPVCFVVVISQFAFFSVMSINAIAIRVARRSCCRLLIVVLSRPSLGAHVVFSMFASLIACHNPCLLSSLVIVVVSSFCPFLGPSCCIASSLVAHMHFSILLSCR